MGLSAGRLIHGGGGGGGLYAGHKKVSDRTDIVRQNENLYLRK